MTEQEKAKLKNYLKDRYGIEDNSSLRVTKPTHGTCCTCQKCGYCYDDCECDRNTAIQCLSLLAENEALRSDNQKLRENLTEFKAKFDKIKLENLDLVQENTKEQDCVKLTKENAKEITHSLRFFAEYGDYDDDLSSYYEDLADEIDKQLAKGMNP